MEARMCSLRLLDEQRDWLDLHASFGAGKAYLQTARLSVEESLLGGVIRRRKPLQVEDRKSTRLNSSHDQISYAVFCLKKKNRLYPRCGQEQCSHSRLGSSRL